MKTERTFGVELELNARIDVFGRKAIWGGWTRLPYHERQDYRVGIKPKPSLILSPGWKCVRDISCGSEFVSPVLHHTEPVKVMIEKIKTSGIPHTFVNTGLHVHVNATDYDEDHIVGIAKFCRHFDRAFFSFFHPDRIKNKFCRPIGCSDTTIKNDLATNTLQRYRGCNIASWYDHGTVEFRYSEGHLDFRKLEAMIDLYVCVVEFCSTLRGKIKSPKKLKDKRLFLLDLVGVNVETYYTLVNCKY